MSMRGVEANNLHGANRTNCSEFISYIAKNGTRNFIVLVLLFVLEIALKSLID